MNFPTLYKKTSTGAIQFWEIKALGLQNNVGKIETRYGQLDTANPQVTYDLITQGKNIGKKNETSVEQQTVAETRAKWEKQKKKGYVESIEAAEAGQVDALIEGGILPMLAHKFAEQGHKIKYPAYVQPKLDGIRCIAILKDGKCTLWSRTRKQITSMPHIVKAIENTYTVDLIFDGELYNSEYKSNFEKIVSLVRQEEPGEGHEVVQYHIYDLIEDGTFFTRTCHIDELLFRQPACLQEVSTFLVDSEEQILEFFNSFLKEGYEGAIVRNKDGKYTNKRSYDLQKVKEFDDGEFDILGIEEGRGKLAGHVGAFLCRLPNGKTFLAKMSGDTANLKNYFLQHSLWTGKSLNVQYQGLTSYGIPRFPVGIRIRESFKNGSL
jgi:DNA ligase-1